MSAVAEGAHQARPLYQAVDLRRAEQLYGEALAIDPGKAEGWRRLVGVRCSPLRRQGFVWGHGSSLLAGRARR